MHPPRRTSRAVATTAAFAASLTLAACSAPDYNARPVFGGATTIPALAPAPADNDLPPLQGVPLARIDRADWGPVEYLAPIDGVAHPPIWRSFNRHTTDQTRAVGVNPTAETALDLPGDQGWRAITETLTAHGVALVDVALIPVRAIIDPPNTRDVSPAVIAKRTTPGEWTSGAPALSQSDAPAPTTNE